MRSLSSLVGRRAMSAQVGTQLLVAAVLSLLLSTAAGASAEPCVFTYKQTFTAYTDPALISIVGASFDFELQLTAAEIGTSGVYQASSGSGTLTRSDVAGGASQGVSLLDKGTFQMNDNQLTYPGTPALDDMGLTVQDDSGVYYNLFFGDNGNEADYTSDPASGVSQSAFGGEPSLILSCGSAVTNAVTTPSAQPTCLFSYSQQFGPGGEEITPTFNFQLQLAATLQSSRPDTYLVTSASGTVTRSDEFGTLTVQLIASGGYMGNDDLLLPNSSPVVDSAGISFLDSSNQDYRIMSQVPGSPLAYYLDYSTAFPGGFAGAYGDTPAVTLLCCLSPGQTTCPVSVTGDPVFVGFHGQRFLVHGLPSACTTCCRCLSCSSTRASSRCRPARP